MKDITTILRILIDEIKDLKDGDYHIENHKKLGINANGLCNVVKSLKIKEILTWEEAENLNDFLNKEMLLNLYPGFESILENSINNNTERSSPYFFERCNWNTRRIWLQEVLNGIEKEDLFTISNAKCHKFRTKRNIVELLEVLLKRLKETTVDGKFPESGLCFLINNMSIISEFITYKERTELLSYMNKHAPNRFSKRYKIYRDTGYFWQRDQSQPRIDWLESRIKIEKRKLKIFQFFNWKKN